jgi:hypothetical protein
MVMQLKNSAKRKSWFFSGMIKKIDKSLARPIKNRKRKKYPQLK